MRVWLDTEFHEDGSRIDLISIGLVREDGGIYYAETKDAHYYCDKSEWLVKNVKPHLQGGGAGRPRSQIRDEILEFAGENPVFIADYADYDWVALCQLFGTMMELPEGWPMFCLDLQQERVMRGVSKLPAQSAEEHHALADAAWCREAWEFVVSHPRSTP